MDFGKEEKKCVDQKSKQAFSLLVVKNLAIRIFFLFRDNTLCLNLIWPCVDGQRIPPYMS